MQYQFENLIRMIRPSPLFVFCFLPVTLNCSGKDRRPVADSVTSRKITLAGFLSKVAAANLDYAAQRYNVSIAKALIAAAKVSPNPTVSAAYFGDISAQNQPSIYTGGISQTIEMGGKRGSRVAVAQR